MPDLFLLEMQASTTAAFLRVLRDNNADCLIFMERVLQCGHNTLCSRDMEPIELAVKIRAVLDDSFGAPEKKAV